MKARDVMISAVVSVAPDTPKRETAELLRDQPKPAAAGEGGLLAEVFAGLDHVFLHRQPPAAAGAPVEPPAKPDDTTPTVSDFQGLMADHEHKKVEHRQDLRRATEERRRDRVAELTDHHISDENWRALLHRARQSAESGEKEFMLLRFPSQLCSDGGRAINITAPNWLETLRGEAAELHLRWERDLKPHGFSLGARLLDFPGGMPGDIGLFIAWERQ